MNIAENIKNIIQDKGVKLSFIAEKMNLPIKTFSYKLLKNSLKANELIKLANILNIDLNKFKEA